MGHIDYPHRASNDDLPALDIVNIIKVIWVISFKTRRRASSFGKQPKLFLKEVLEKHLQNLESTSFKIYQDHWLRGKNTSRFQPGLGIREWWLKSKHSLASIRDDR